MKISHNFLRTASNIRELSLAAGGNSAETFERILAKEQVFQISFAAKKLWFFMPLFVSI